MKVLSYILVAVISFGAAFVVCGGFDSGSNTYALSDIEDVITETKDPTEYSTYYDQLTDYQKELYNISTTENMTFIFVTHNIQEALTLGTRVILMGKQGEILIDDENLLEKPVKPSRKGYGEMWDKFSTALAEASK